MGTMAKMRGLAPWFILTVGGLFVVFMILSDSKVTEIVGTRNNSVGSINGEEISYQAFSSYLSNAKKDYSQRTGIEIEEDQMSFLRDQVWDQIVSQYLLQEKIKEYDIVVSNEEIANTILGNTPPAFLTQSFIDSTGNLDRRAYEAAITDPANEEIMINAENAVRQNLIVEKLQKLLLTTVNVSNAEVKQKFIDDNIKMSADYIYINSTSIPDSSVTVTDEEMLKYYEENKESYKTKEEAKIKYVLFRNVASKSDTANIRKTLDSHIAKLEKDTSTFKTYVDIYSSIPYSRDTLSINRIPLSVSTKLVNAKPGDIIEPTITNEGYAIYRIISKKPGKDTYARASHILIKPVNGNDDEAKSKADDLYNRLISGENFAELAKEFSEDPGSAVRGGDLGWFGKGQMVPEFEQASFSGRVNQIQKPFKTQFGYHIVKVISRSNTEFVLEKLVNKLEPSPGTIDKIYESASDFAYLADKNGFDKETELADYEVIESSPFQETFSVIPGLGANKALVKFAFENSINEVSSVFKLTQGYVVATITEKTSEHIRPFEEVKDRIRPVLAREKKLDKAKETAIKVRVLVLQSNNLFDAKQIDPTAKINTIPEFSTGKAVPGLGNEYVFSEYALNAELNQLSEPVVGEGGAYLIRVLSRTEFDTTAFDLQKSGIRDQLIQQLQNSFFQQWIAKLKEGADIVDNRHLFYR